MPNGDLHEPPALPPVNCRVCGQILLPQPVGPAATRVWERCLRRCEIDQVGFSNAPVDPTFIYGPPVDRNVPEPVRAGRCELWTCR